MFFKTVAQAFVAKYSPNILLRFLSFRGTFSYKKFSDKKTCIFRVLNDLNGSKILKCKFLLITSRKALL